MLGSDVCRLEDVTLPNKQDNSRHFQSQFFKIAHAKLCSLNGRLTNWAMLLSPYDMQFIPQITIKG